MFFADLDRTLIYSADALDLRMPDVEAPRLLCVEMYKGRPASFVTEAAAAGIGRLLKAQMLVPVTTRSVEQYRRVHLPGPKPHLALVANGGRLLRDDTVDEDYSKSTTSLLEASTPLELVFDHLTSVGHPRFCINVRAVENLFCYAVVDVDVVPPGWITELTEYAAGIGWGVSDQGRKVYLLPNALTKGQAARSVADACGLGGFIAAGDTNTDEPMLIEASDALIPRHGALARQAARLGMCVTGEAGVLAGAELVAWAEGRLLANTAAKCASTS